MTIYTGPLRTRREVGLDEIVSGLGEAQPGEWDWARIYWRHVEPALHGLVSSIEPMMLFHSTVFAFWGVFLCRAIWEGAFGPRGQWLVGSAIAVLSFGVVYWTEYLPYSHEFPAILSRRLHPNGFMLAFSLLWLVLIAKAISAAFDRSDARAEARWRERK